MKDDQKVTSFDVIIERAIKQKRKELRKWQKQSHRKKNKNFLH